MCNESRVRVWCRMRNQQLELFGCTLVAREATQKYYRVTTDSFALCICFAWWFSDGTRRMYKPGSEMVQKRALYPVQLESVVLTRLASSRRVIALDDFFFFSLSQKVWVRANKFTSSYTEQKLSSVLLCACVSLVLNIKLILSGSQFTILFLHLHVYSRHAIPLTS